MRARRAAKTAIDEVVQEMLLDTVKSVTDLETTALDAEEDTPSVGYFYPRGEAPRTVVIDPIDGTYEYLNGRDTYSICVGVCENGKVTRCGVYFPARQVGYLLPDDGVPTYYDAGVGTFERLEAPDAPSKVVFKNGRVPEAVVKCLETAGFVVKDDTDDQVGASGAILACLDGTAAAYICHTRNVRDIFLGPVIAALPGGFELDWQGNDLEWPNGGRIDRALFGAAPAFRDEIVACLADN